MASDRLKMSSRDLFVIKQTEIVIHRAIKTTIEMYKGFWWANSIINSNKSKNAQSNLLQW